MAILDYNLSILLTIAITLAVLLIFNYVYKFYLRVKLYPRGPMPLPVIGNCLTLITHLGRHPCFFFQRMAQKYRETFTFWLGTQPIVIINRIGLAKMVFNKEEFSDRCEPSLQSRFNELFFYNYPSFGFMNNSDELKLLRTVSLKAIKKFLATDNLSIFTNNIIKETVDVIKQREIDKPFVPIKYIESIFIRLLTKSIFGKQLPFEGEMVDKTTLFFDSVQINFIRFFISEFIPLYKYTFNINQYKASNDSVNNMFTVCYKDMVESHVNADNCNNIAEALIAVAINTRIKNKNKTNEYLSERNMIGALITLFLAASDSSHTTFKWIMLLLVYYPEMQQKMRNEINDNIGNNKIADLSDKEKCVYVKAFICEALRYRNVSTMSFHHMTSCDTDIEGISIPKGTSVLINQLAILNDSSVWENPEIFNPERFIDSDRKLIASELTSFIPFSTGKRMCFGDRFAMNMLFFVLSSLLQATAGMKFELVSKQHSALEPQRFGFLLEPKIFKIILAKN